MWVVVIKPGRIIFEMEGVTDVVAKEAMRLAAHKLSVATQVVQRPGAGAAHAG
jgi:large subunit ribosomal protein L16